MGGRRADEAALREQMLAAVRRLDTLGLNRGSTGNLSLRQARDARAGMLITPTGAGADDLEAADLVWVGEGGEVEGLLAPSSEWPFHQAAYARRAEVQAVVHTHSPNAAALSCLGRGLPPFHYMVAVAGGTRCRARRTTRSAARRCPRPWPTRLPTATRA